MNIQALSDQQRIVAIQRLTALWAFSESGLGGVMHALKIPFTGLLVGGFAVIIITLIAQFSAGQFSKLFHSLIIVLLVKAAVSPHTPFPAYLAVSFQAIVGYILFSLLQVNFISTLLLSVLAMIESAIQKLLVLTFFFGKSFWQATSELSSFIAKQFSLQTLAGSNWLVISYLLIYFIGGIVIAVFTNRIIQRLSSDQPVISLELENNLQRVVTRKKQHTIFKLLLLLVGISTVLYFTTEVNDRTFSIFNTIVWTLTAIVIWYTVLSPLFTRMLMRFLKQHKSRYSEEMNQTMVLLPAFRTLTTAAWIQSRSEHRNRLASFLFLLIHFTLTYTYSENER